MYKIVLLFIGLPFLFLSCVGSKEKELKILLNEWMGKEILYPENTSECDDSIMKSLKSEYKVFVYTDSLGCVSCKLNLGGWNAFISMVDSLAPKKVSFLFVFQPNRLNELKMMLRKDKFLYPSYIDVNGEFNALNHFPSDMSYQTFLLDKDNKVVAIGNPVLNPKVKELYLKIIQGGSLQEEDTASDVQTTVSTSSTVLSLGTFPWQEEQSDTFALTNTGAAPLLVQDVVTSCGCLTVDYPREPIRSGGEAVLRVRYKADHPGYFSKSVTVYSNAEGSPLKLTVSGVGE